MTATPFSPTLQARGIAKRALSGHAAIGLLTSALIYIIALTGAIAVVHDRWQRWEEPNVAEYPAISPAAAQAALASALALETDKPATEHLYIRMPTPDLPRAVVTTDNAAWYVDEQGQAVAREGHSWTEFILALHINLTLPIVWGMLLVGALGVALAALLITGVIAHPKIFRDAFRLRARHDSQIARADWHNRLGVWTLPFALAIALTGAFIGLSYAGVAVLSEAYEGGDMEAVYAPIFGDEPAHDAAPAPLADIARALVTVQTRFPETTPTYVTVHDPGMRGQFVQVLAEHPRRLIYGEAYSFDGDANYLGKVGLSDGAAGKQAAASTYNLHFGNFAGLPVELAYILFGLTLSAITATGTTLWLQKRRRRGLPTERLWASWRMVVWGVPTALAVAVWERWLVGPDAPLVATFWLLLVAGIGAAGAAPARVTEASMRSATIAALLITVVLHMALFRAFEAGVLAVNLALIGIALILAYIQFGRLLRTSDSRSGGNVEKVVAAE